MRNLSFVDSQIVTELINWMFLPVNCFNMIGTRCSQVLNRREKNGNQEIRVNYWVYVVLSTLLV